LEPIRDKLQAGFQSDQLEVDKDWEKRLKEELMSSSLELVAKLGGTHLLTREVRDLKIGDVILLDRYASDSIDVYVDGIPKFKAYPGVHRGNQALQIQHLNSRKEVTQYGAE
jgi:flagellar motor switch protein FliM